MHLFGWDNVAAQKAWFGKELGESERTNEDFCSHLAALGEMCLIVAGLTLEPSHGLRYMPG